MLNLGSLLTIHDADRSNGHAAFADVPFVKGLGKCQKYLVASSNMWHSRVDTLKVSQQEQQLGSVHCLHRFLPPVHATHLSTPVDTFNTTLPKAELAMQHM